MPFVNLERMVVEYNLEGLEDFLFCFCLSFVVGWV